MYFLASSQATFKDMVDLPTPPLQLAKAIIFLESVLFLLLFKESSSKKSTVICEKLNSLLIILMISDFIFSLCSELSVLTLSIK